MKRGGVAGIIMFDIDYFKTVNDTYGHEMGDAVLRKISEVVQKNVRPADIIGRYGGEEFIV
ncbi:GGDEF domain-containing protein, partial [Escherichia coli]|nr:GGDEF domain-containing protein [Escherichia coli]